MNTLAGVVVLVLAIASALDERIWRFAVALAVLLIAFGIKLPG